MSKRIHHLFYAVLILAVAVSGIIPSHKVSALSGSMWQAGRIIDDPIFTDTSMPVDQIQGFLNQLVPNCDTWGTQPASEYGRSDLTHAQYATQVKGWPGPPYVCLRNYHEVPKTSPGPGTPANSYTNGGNPPANSISAAQMIYNAAKQYNISPKVLLVKIQTESAGLTRDTWPLQSQYTYAMGSHCPDSGPGGSAQCDGNYAGFSIQIAEAASQLRYYLDNMQQPWWPYKKPFATNSVLWNTTSRGCGASDVYIGTKATAALYTYTPYQPNSAALQKVSNTSSGGLGDSCSAYGNRNFWWWFNYWFGSTYAYINNGLDYYNVFNAEYYLANNPDLQAIFNGNGVAAFDHFIRYGMAEGRQANASFSVTSYRNRYADLRWAFGTNLSSYYWHYIAIGKAEGRTATGEATIQPVTSLGGVDYSSVYNFATYLENNPDVRNRYTNDDTGALWHFVTYGMAEGRQANASFSVTSYRNRYLDLRSAFGNNLRQYYIHYMSTGKAEGRTATGSYLGGTSVLGGTNYSAIYNFNDYSTINPDIQNVYGNKTDDTGALWHFVTYGMAEGRQASSEFNVQSYRAQNPDLQNAFGNNLRQYYIHYMSTGKAEGRSGT